MRAPKLLTPILGVALTAACSSYSEPGPPPQFTYAAAARTCGPADGPGVAIYFAAVPIRGLEPPTPYIRVVVWQSVEHISGGSWFVAAGDTAAAAWRFASPDSFEVGTAGQIVVTLADTTATIRGTADLTFPSFGHVAGAFYATWFSRALLCG